MPGEPVVTVLVGAEGGVAPDGESAKLIRRQLKSALKAATSKQPLEVKVGVQGGSNADGESAKLIQRQLRQALRGMSGKTPLEVKVGVTTPTKEQLQRQLNKLKGLTIDVKANVVGINTKNVKNSGVQQNRGGTQRYITLDRLERANTTAAIQRDKFAAYTHSLRPSVVSESQKAIDDINRQYASAMRPNNTRAIRDLAEANLSVQSLKANLKLLGKDGGSAMDHLVGKFKTFSTYLVSSAATLALVGSITKAIKVTYDLNQAMTDLQIVTGGTKKQAEELVGTYNQMAQSMGTTTKNVSDAAVEWLRQGYNMADTQKLIEDSMVLSIVGFMDSDAAAQALTATMKGYQLSVEDAIGAVDKFTAVDMAAATSAGDIATALSKTAANAKLAGISLNDVIGQLARVNETMQEAPETTGVFYNTMLSRMGMIKAGRLSDPESGENLSDVETTLKSMGIALRDSGDNFRNFGVVLDEVGDKWDSYSNVQQRAIATAFAGTRQQTRFIALMEGWEEAAKYSEIAANSTGTAMNKFAVYQESLAAKTERATAAFERLSTVLVDSDFVGYLLDGGTALLNIFADIGSIGGGAVATMTEFALALLAISSAAKMVKNSTFTQGILESVGAMKTAYTSYMANAAAATTVTGMLGRSITGVGAALKAAMIAHPILAVITAAVTLLSLFDALTTSVEEQAEITNELRQEYSGLASEISTMESELKGIRDRIAELKGMGTLSITEQEELNRLQKQNDELERQLRIKEQLAAQAANDLGSSAMEEFNKKSYSVDRSGESYSVQRYLSDDIAQHGISGQIHDADKAVGAYIAEIQRLEGMREELTQQFEQGLVSEKFYQNGLEAFRKDIESTKTELASLIGDVSQWYRDTEKATDPEVTAFRDMLSGLLDEYDQFTTQVETKSTVFSDIWGKAELSGTVKVLSTLARNGKLTAETLADPVYAKFVNELERAGVIGGETGVTLNQVVKEIQNMAAESDKAANNTVNFGGKLHTLDTALGEVIDRYELYTATQKELKKEGSISADTLSKILKSFGEGSEIDLTQNVQEYILGIRTAAELLADLKKAYDTDEENFEALLRSELYMREEFYNSLTSNQKQLIDGFGKSYNTDLSNFKTVEEKKLAIQAAIIQKMLGNLSKYSGMSYEQLKAEQSKLGAFLGAQPDSSKVPDFMLNPNQSQVVPNAGDLINAYTQGIQRQEYDKVTAALNEIDRVNKEIDEIIGEIDFEPVLFDKPSKGSSSTTEKYVVQIDAAREALLRLEQVTNRIAQGEARLALIPEDDELKRQEAMVDLIGLYGDKMKAIEDLNISRIQAIMKIANQLRGVGFDVDYDWKNHSFFVKNLEHLNELGAGLEVKERNKLIKQYEQLIEKAEEYNKANVDGALEYINLQKQIQNMQKDYLAMWKEQLEETQDNLKSVLDLVKDMIKQESEDMIDALEKQSDAYKKIIEMKKRSLELTEKERDYQKGVKDRTDKIRKLQERIDALSMDDSREAYLERQKLLEQLSQLQEDLTEYQHDHSIEAQQDALDQDLKDYEDNIDSKIDEIKKFLQDQGRLTEEAYDRIDREGDDLFDNLLSYALKYTDTTRVELERMWEDALNAAKEYGSFVNAMEGITGSLGDMEDGNITPGSDTWTKILNQMKELGSQWGSASEEQRKAIAERSLHLGTSIGATRDENGVWWYRGEKLFGGRYDTTLAGGSWGGSDNAVPAPGSAEFDRIIARMRELGSQWGSARPDKQKEIAAESLRLGTSIGAVRDNNGVWWYRGQKLFDIYHSGGEVGSVRPRSNEVFALMEKGEVVMNSNQQSKLLPMLQESVGLRGLLSQLLLSGGKFASGDTAAPSISIIDNTMVTVSDKSEFRQYLSENRREVANLVAKEFSK